MTNFDVNCYMSHPPLSISIPEIDPTVMPSPSAFGMIHGGQYIHSSEADLSASNGGCDNIDIVDEFGDFLWPGMDQKFVSLDEIGVESNANLHDFFDCGFEADIDHFFEAIESENGCSVNVNIDCSETSNDDDGGRGLVEERVAKTVASSYPPSVSICS